MFDEAMLESSLSPTLKNYFKIICNINNWYCYNKIKDAYIMIVNERTDMIIECFICWLKLKFNKPKQ